MSTIKLEFPVWVRYENDEYHVRPLLMPGPEAVQDRYEKAFKNLSKQIHKHFSGVTLRKESLAELLWFRFNPSLHFELIELEFRYGQRYFSGPISVAWFPFEAHTVVVLPAFDNFIFFSSHASPGTAELIDEVTTQLQRIVRARRSEFDEEILLDTYRAVEGEYCTSMDLHLHIEEEKISFGEGDEESIRNFFRQETHFEGREEIARVGEPLNDLYPESLDRAWYRQSIVEPLMHSLFSHEHVPIVILGARQSGKTAVIHEAVYQYIAQKPASDLYMLDHLWTIDPTRIIAGMSIVGMWQRRLESILDFALKPLDKNARQDILHFRNVVALFRIGKSSQNNMTLSDVLKPYMESRRLQFVFEATSEEWDVASEMDRGFTDMCKVIRVDEPEEATALRILGRVRNRMEEAHRVVVDGEVLLKLMELQRRFFSRHSLVGGVATRLHQLAVKYAGKDISERMAIDAFEAQTHMKPDLAERDRKISEEEMEQYIEQRLIGQPTAVRRMIDLLHSIKAGLNNPDRPYGSFLFIGPTGVGKTEAAKVLADYLFTHDDRLLRFDMNEFIDDYAVNRLVGDLSQPEGQLTSKVRFNPFCVLLFDEIEKAHPEVHNLLLQVLGEGRLTDALGRTVSFANTIIIMTSNLGADRVGREIRIRRGETLSAGTYEKAVHDFFRPEFVNRIDQLVVFHPLLPVDIARIARLQIGALLKRHGFARRHTFLNVSPEVLESIAEKGFDPLMGGRALKRQIEKEMTVLLADQLVGIPPGNPILFELRLEDGRIVPHITHLRHIQARQEPLFPDFGDRAPGIRDFERLLSKVQLTKDDLLGEEEASIIELSGEDDELNFELRMRDEIYRLEDQLQQLIWDYHARKYVDFAKSNFQLKTITRKEVDSYRRGWAGETMYLRDLYHQIDVIEYLNEASQAAENLIGASQTLWMEMALQLSWIQRRIAAYDQDGVDYVVMRFSPSDKNQRLTTFYRLAFAHEAQVYVKKDATARYIGMVGPGLYDILQSEVGYQLYFGKGEAPYWAKMEVFRLPEDVFRQWVEKGESVPAAYMPAISVPRAEEPVVRLHHNTKDTDWTATDLYTGMVFDAKPLNESIMQSLLYAHFLREFQITIDDDETT